MEKEFSNVSNYNHSISIHERKQITINGVKKMINFDDQQFLLDTIMGSLTIKGRDLDLIKMDSAKGIISINGNINSVCYSDEGENRNNFFGRLFK